MPAHQQVDYDILADIANRIRIHSVTSTSACNSGWQIQIEFYRSILYKFLTYNGNNLSVTRSSELFCAYCAAFLLFVSCGISRSFKPRNGIDTRYGNCSPLSPNAIRRCRLRNEIIHNLI